jgi:hypothetical protein
MGLIEVMLFVVAPLAALVVSWIVLYIIDKFDDQINS